MYFFSSLYGFSLIQSLSSFSYHPDNKLVSIVFLSRFTWVGSVRSSPKAASKNIENFSSVRITDFRLGQKESKIYDNDKKQSRLSEAISEVFLTYLEKNSSNFSFQNRKSSLGENKKSMAFRSEMLKGQMRPIKREIFGQGLEKSSPPVITNATNKSKRTGSDLSLTWKEQEKQSHFQKIRSTSSSLSLLNPFTQSLNLKNFSMSYPNVLNKTIIMTMIKKKRLYSNEVFQFEKGAASPQTKSSNLEDSEVVNLFSSRLKDINKGYGFKLLEKNFQDFKIKQLGLNNKNKLHTSYSKLAEIKLITIALASPEKIRQWAEKTLPTGKVVGQVTNANTFHHKTFKPLKGGLFCERIFGPLKDFECACGKIQKPIASTKKLHGSKTRSELIPNREETGVSSSKSLLQTDLGATFRLVKEPEVRHFCPNCDVEYTWSVLRRYQLGFIQLASPTTHVWYVKANPSHLSILLDMKRKYLEYVIYCSETMTLENALKGDQNFHFGPKSLFDSWQKLMKNSKKVQPLPNQITTEFGSYSKSLTDRYNLIKSIVGTKDITESSQKTMQKSFSHQSITWAINSGTKDHQLFFNLYEFQITKHFYDLIFAGHAKAGEGKDIIGQTSSRFLTQLENDQKLSFIDKNHVRFLFFIKNKLNLDRNFEKQRSIISKDWSVAGVNTALLSSISSTPNNHFLTTSLGNTTDRVVSQKALAAFLKGLFQADSNDFTRRSLLLVNSNSRCKNEDQINLQTFFIQSIFFQKNWQVFLKNYLKLKTVENEFSYEQISYSLIEGKNIENKRSEDSFIHNKYLEFHSSKKQVLNAMNNDIKLKIIDQRTRLKKRESRFLREMKRSILKNLFFLDNSDISSNFKLEKMNNFVKSNILYNLLPFNKKKLITIFYNGLLTRGIVSSFRNQLFFDLKNEIMKKLPIPDYLILKQTQSNQKKLFLNFSNKIWITVYKNSYKKSLFRLSTLISKLNLMNLIPKNVLQQYLSNCNFSKALPSLTDVCPAIPSPARSEPQGLRTLGLWRSPASSLTQRAANARETRASPEGLEEVQLGKAQRTSVPSVSHLAGVSRRKGEGGDGSTLEKPDNPREDSSSTTTEFLNQEEIMTTSLNVWKLFDNIDLCSFQSFCRLFVQNLSKKVKTPIMKYFFYSLSILNKTIFEIQKLFKKHLLHFFISYINLNKSKNSKVKKSQLSIPRLFKFFINKKAFPGCTSVSGCHSAKELSVSSLLKPAGASLWEGREGRAVANKVPESHLLGTSDLGHTNTYFVRTLFSQSENLEKKLKNLLNFLANKMVLPLFLNKLFLSNALINQTILIEKKFGKMEPYKRIIQRSGERLSLHRDEDKKKFCELYNRQYRKHIPFLSVAAQPRKKEPAYMNQNQQKNFVGSTYYRLSPLNIQNVSSFVEKVSTIFEKQDKLLDLNRSRKYLSNFKIINNIYLFSHRDLWETEQDWQFFALYYYASIYSNDYEIPCSTMNSSIETYKSLNQSFWLLHKKSRTHKNSFLRQKSVLRTDSTKLRNIIPYPALAASPSYKGLWLSPASSQRETRAGEEVQPGLGFSSPASSPFGKKQRREALAASNPNPAFPAGEGEALAGAKVKGAGASKVGELLTERQALDRLERLNLAQHSSRKLNIFILKLRTKKKQKIISLLSTLRYNLFLNHFLNKTNRGSVEHCSKLAYRNTDRSTFSPKEGYKTLSPRASSSTAIRLLTTGKAQLLTPPKVKKQPHLYGEAGKAVVGGAASCGLLYATGEQPASRLWERMNLEFDQSKTDIELASSPVALTIKVSATALKLFPNPLGEGRNEPANDSSSPSSPASSQRETRASPEGLEEGQPGLEAAPALAGETKQPFEENTIAQIEKDSTFIKQRSTFSRIRISENKIITSSKNDIIKISGAGVLKKLLSELDFEELKKIDKQNRIILYLLNKQIQRLKRKFYSREAKTEFKESSRIRDLLIRRTKLVRTLARPSFSLSQRSSPSFSNTAGFSRLPVKVSSATPSPASSLTQRVRETRASPEGLEEAKGEEGSNSFVNQDLNLNRINSRSEINHSNSDLELSYNPKNKLFSSSIEKNRDSKILIENKNFFFKKNAPTLAESMILTNLPVLPPDLRPIVKISGQIAVSDLNRLYQRVIYRNDRLKKFLKDSATSSSYEMKYAQRLLQEAVDNLIQNGKSGVVSERDSRGRLLKSLSDILKGKQGRFRQYLLGKRVDYSGRSVIVVGPKLKLHECGIPKEMAIELYLPFLLKRILNQNFAKTVVGAKKLIKTNQSLACQLLREIMEVSPVLLNRAPTLHRLGFQAFQPKLIEGRAILLHPLVCPAFNADFDGDQMAVHIPLTVEARTEAWKLMFSRNNLLSPATGEPIILPSQDMVLGCYYLTTNTNKFAITSQRGYKNIFANFDDVLKAYNQQKIDLHAILWVKWNGFLEINNELEQPLEIRITADGSWLEIYTNVQRNFDSKGLFINQFIRTTPGKILFNTLIQNSLTFVA
uniref:DNA-directed RNA polymerase subunit beta' n=1 Tax=Lobochlamys segnis TaxID=52035 RepID=A0A0S2IBA2_9CHLO|nr:beta' subunit of RNA polymerase [Lobochlamys segnis]